MSPPAPPPTPPHPHPSPSHAVFTYFSAITLSRGHTQALREDGIDSSLPEMEALWAALKGEEHEASWGEALEQLHAEYTFAPDNPYAGGAELLARGTELFQRGELAEARRPPRRKSTARTIPVLLRGGSRGLPARLAPGQAVLCLEAAVQQSPEDSIAWQTLGQAS